MFRSLVSAFALCLACASAASATALLNGSFEESATENSIRNKDTFDSLLTGPGRSWDIWGNLPGWQSDAGAGIEIQSNRTLGSIDAHSGGHYVELDSHKNSSMYQDVVLTAGDYILGFQYSPRRSDLQSMGIAFSVEGLLSGNVDTGSARHSVGTWSTVSRLFTVNATDTYRVRFTATGKSDSYGGLIDSVSLRNASSSAPPAAIPLPLSGVLLLGGLGALALTRKLRAS